MILKRPEKLRNSLTRTRQSVFGRLAGLFTQSELPEETWEELEALLLQADVGVETTVDFTKKEDVWDRLAARVGTGAAEAFTRLVGWGGALGLR